MEPLAIAVVGCGAIAEKAHLPVLIKSGLVKVTLLVDNVLPRAQEVAEKFQIPQVAEDIDSVADCASAAVVCLPHGLHAPVCIDLLKRGVHVLVEKPMALRVDDCEQMIKQASEADRILAVGLVCRHYDSTRFVRDYIQSGCLGNVTGFDVRQGNVYSWPVADVAMLRPDIGGGVLTALGPHVLDLLLWWLGDYDEVTYYDDAKGGIEANCEIHLKLTNGASGIVELSRTRNLRNTYIIKGERGTLEVDNAFNKNPEIKLWISGQVLRLSGRVESTRAEVVAGKEGFLRQIEDFAISVMEGRPPVATGKEGMKAVALIEECLNIRRPLDFPWDEVYLMEPMKNCEMAIAGQ